MTDLSLGVTVTRLNKKPALIIRKQIINEQEVKILSQILLDQGTILVPITIEDKLSFYSKLKKNKII